MTLQFAFSPSWVGSDKCVDTLSCANLRAQIKPNPSEFGCLLRASGRQLLGKCSAQLSDTIGERFGWRCFTCRIRLKKLQRSKLLNEMAKETPDPVLVFGIWVIVLGFRQISGAIVREYCQASLFLFALNMGVPCHRIPWAVRCFLLLFFSGDWRKYKQAKKPPVVAVHARVNRFGRRKALMPTRCLSCPSSWLAGA